DDLGLEGRQGRALEAACDACHEDDPEDRGKTQRRVTRQKGERHGAGDRECARDQDDASPVAPVRDMTTEENEREGWDGLDQSEPAECQGIAGDVVDLEADDRGEGAEPEAVGHPSAKQGTKVVLPEEGLKD